MPKNTEEDKNQQGFKKNSVSKQHPLALSLVGIQQCGASVPLKKRWLGVRGLDGDLN